MSTQFNKDDIIQIKIGSDIKTGNYVSETDSSITFKPFGEEGELTTEKKNKITIIQKAGELNVNDGVLNHRRMTYGIVKSIDKSKQIANVIVKTFGAYSMTEIPLNYLSKNDSAFASLRIKFKVNETAKSGEYIGYASRKANFKNSILQCVAVSDTKEVMKEKGFSKSELKSRGLDKSENIFVLSVPSHGYNLQFFDFEIKAITKGLIKKKRLPLREGDVLKCINNKKNKTLSKGQKYTFKKLVKKNNNNKDLDIIEIENIISSRIDRAYRKKFKVVHQEREEVKPGDTEAIKVEEVVDLHYSKAFLLCNNDVVSVAKDQELVEGEHHISANNNKYLSTLVDSEIYFELIEANCLVEEDENYEAF